MLISSNYHFFIGVLLSLDRFWKECSSRTMDASCAEFTSALRFMLMTVIRKPFLKDLVVNVSRFFELSVLN